MVWPQFQKISPGVWFAIAAPLAYSATIPFSKILLRQVEPWMLAGLLDFTGGLSVALLYLLRWGITRQPPTAQLQGKDWKWLWGSMVAGGLLAPVLQTFGIAHSTASTASLLLNLEGVFTAGIAWIVFREKFNHWVALGLLTITAGSIILVWQGDSAFQLSTGALAIMGACVAWATSSNLTAKVSASDPLQVVMFRLGVSGGLNVVLAAALGNPFPSLPVLGAIALIGFFCVSLTFLSFVMALRYIGASGAGAFFSLFPFSGAVLSVLILSEPITHRLLIAAVVMAIGLGFCLSRKMPQIK
jgi:drug/metabolite transporter (DMT)-like permease